MRKAAVVLICVTAICMALMYAYFCVPNSSFTVDAIYRQGDELVVELYNNKTGTGGPSSRTFQTIDSAYLINCSEVHVDYNAYYKDIEELLDKSFVSKKNIYSQTNQIVPGKLLPAVHLKLPRPAERDGMRKKWFVVLVERDLKQKHRAFYSVAYAKDVTRLINE